MDNDKLREAIRAMAFLLMCIVGIGLAIALSIFVIGYAITAVI